MSLHKTPTEHFDYAVVGAGIEGSWTALQLAREYCPKGARVVLLEQFRLPHSRGSSHGQTRIIRHAYREPYHAALMPGAFQEWRALENKLGTQLLIPTPLLTVAGDSNGYVALDETIASLRKVIPGGEGTKFRVLDSAQLRREFPQASYSEKHRGVVEDCAGILLADRCLVAVQQEFVSCGGELRDNCIVTCLTPAPKVRLDVRRNGMSSFIVANHVAVCTGPWAAKLLDPLLPIKLPLTPLRVNVYYWQIKKDGPGAIKASFIDLGEEGEFWGIPEMEYPGLVKYLHPTTLKADPDNRDVAISNNECELKEICDHISRNFPGVDSSKPALVETCMYTMTPDLTSIIDSIPGHANVVFACGFSGTGFKKAPAIGQLVAELLNPLPETCSKLKPYSMLRFK